MSREWRMERGEGEEGEYGEGRRRKRSCSFYRTRRAQIAKPFWRTVNCWTNVILHLCKVISGPLDGVGRSGAHLFVLRWVELSMSLSIGDC